jgi:hypothetical protein
MGEEEKQIIIDDNSVPLSSALLMVYRMVKDMKESMDKWFDDYRKSGALVFDRRISENTKDIECLKSYEPMLANIKDEREKNKEGWYSLKFSILHTVIIALLASSVTGICLYLVLSK